MDTEKLKVLLYAIDSGTLSAASEKLGYTPSGISRMMATLEAETGFPLLIRSHGGVAPTPECQKLLPVIREMVYLNDKFYQQSQAIRGIETGNLTIGTAYGAYYKWLSHTIASFSTTYPGISVNTLYGSSSELFDSIVKHHADLCIISKRNGISQWQPLCRDELVVLLPKNHKMASMPSFPVEAFTHEPYIHIWPGVETDATLMFDKFRINPNVRFTCIDPLAAFSMVEAGLGITIMNNLMVQNLTFDIAVLPLEPRQYVDIGIAMPDDEKVSPIVQRFLDYIENNMPEI